MARSRTFLGLAAVSLTVIAAAEAGAVRPQLSDWQTVEDHRYGYMIAYPGNLFQPDPSRSQGDGLVFTSRDGRARLLVATFENESNASLAEYRQQLVEENYPDARLDYTPMNRKWFVLSGTDQDTHFYYRVTFTCGGRLINSWALIYPAAERRLYDRVVDAVAKSYTAGAGRNGTCD